MWASGSPYEAYVGRWSRLVVREFLAWLGVPGGGRWLDVDCGTGALSEAILREASPAEVVGLDPSAGFIAHARQHLKDARARFGVGDAQALPFEDDAFDAVVSGLVLNFLPSPTRGVAEMVRVVRPGGTVAAYVWDYAGEMQVMRRFWDAAAALDPAARDLDEGRRFPICRPEPLERLWSDGGLGSVRVRPIDVPTVFRDFDDYWTPFLGGQGPAPSYVAPLDEQRRMALRERLRADLQAGDDGSIAMKARAWAVRGIAHPR
ncbi:MAG: class I SAM-dependent methyltransferase [Chloroflexota bacterium]|nr:class I SAM-dependent methyltransferase [Chloroflexota bacterium]